MSTRGGGSRKSKWGEPPAGYVPGLGRGASGFTTRSDIGNMALGGKEGGDGDDDEGVSNTVGSGSRASEQRAAKLAAQKPAAQQMPTPQDEEDDEADQIWQAIEDRMNAKKRQKLSTAEDDPSATARAKIGAQFRELKQELAQVSEEDWLKIPEVGDHSLRHKQSNKIREDTYTPLTDSLLESRASANSSTASMKTAIDGGITTTTTLQGLGAARGTVLGMSLDKMSDSVSGQTVVDPQGYLTSMASTQVGSTNVGDIQKARLLLKSVRDTNPKHGPGWIASARVEGAAGKLLKARKIIQEGCQIWRQHDCIPPRSPRVSLPLQYDKSHLRYNSS